MSFGGARGFKINGLLTLMAFVVVVAVAIAGTKHFVEREKEREARVDMLLGIADGHAISVELGGVPLRLFADAEAMRIWEQERASYHRQMERKYREAAKEPWKPIPPDPPEPPRP